MALVTRHGRVLSFQREPGICVVIKNQLLPIVRAGVTGFTTSGFHPFIELPAMNIRMAIGAPHGWKVKNCLERIRPSPCSPKECRPVNPDVTLVARHGHMGPCELEPALGVVMVRRKKRRYKPVWRMTGFATSGIGPFGKLSGMSVRVANRAGVVGESLVDALLFRIGLVAFFAVHQLMFADQRVTGPGMVES